MDKPSVLTEAEVDAYSKWIGRKDTQRFLTLALAQAKREAPQVDIKNPTLEQGMLVAGFDLGFESLKSKIMALDLPLRLLAEQKKLAKLTADYAKPDDSNDKTGDTK